MIKENDSMTVDTTENEKVVKLIDIIFKGFGNYNSRLVTRQEQTEKFAQHLLESDTPRLWYYSTDTWESGHGGDALALKETNAETIRAHYFSKYMDSSDSLNAGTTFSMKSLTERPEGKTDAVLYIADKTNMGFTVHNVQYTEVNGVESVSGIHSLYFNLEDKELHYFKNLHQLKNTYINIENALRSPMNFFGEQEVLFTLSPRDYPHMYSNFYQEMSAMNYESRHYIGRFLRRFIDSSYLEAIAKSGLPESVIQHILSNHKEMRLDEDRGSAREMLRYPKPLWKLLRKGLIPEQELTNITRHLGNVDKLRKKVALAKPFEPTEEQMIDGRYFINWLDRKLPKVSAYRLTHGRRAMESYHAYCLRRDTFWGKQKKIEDLRIMHMNPRIKTRYHEMYLAEMTEDYIEESKIEDKRLRTFDRDYQTFLRIVTFSHQLNEQYGVNFTRAVIAGEGSILRSYDPYGDIIGHYDESATSAIGIHKTYGFDLKRLVAYIYYQVPLDQGFELRASNRQRYFSDIDNRTYSDYLRMSSAISPDYERYPKYLKVAHDIVASNTKLVKNAEFSRRLEEQYESHKHLEDTQIARSPFTMILPKNVDDFVREGQAMGNCVQSYAHSVASGKKIILFLREKLAPDKAVADIEIVDNTIVQALQRFNQPLSKKHKEFLERYAELHDLKLAY